MKNALITDVRPRNAPAGARQCSVTVCGCDFAVAWDSDDSQPDPWVACVALDGKWWHARDVFRDAFCDQLDAALVRMLEAQAAV